MDTRNNAKLWMAVALVVTLVVVGCGSKRRGGSKRSSSGTHVGQQDTGATATPTTTPTAKGDGTFDICALVDPKAIGEALAVPANKLATMSCDPAPPKKDSVRTTHSALINVRTDTVAGLVVAFMPGAGGQERDAAATTAKKRKVTQAQGIGDVAYYYETPGSNFKLALVAAKRIGNDSVLVMVNSTSADAKPLLPTLKQAIDGITTFVG
ncbi:hypothetical protein [Virgisporangium aurantiacum]|uniref:Uncharacterized protein n=1 Tax=Virgisporangium aurantiacum TaxID=175570 RepID=A0A8J3Z3Y5_9ACTN|nr:hypothetical protein [Virgisporangium aurantiacum]GIJ57076.1 hypothetical protein Vau01_045920 [Virgisporangium aurantiacum]